MAVGNRVDQFRALTRQAARDLFNQREPFGRLALVQVLMLAGDTLVTISLAGSLFFSISPHEAKGKVLLYLLITLAPFAVVSPLLGPLIDRSRNARRAMVVFAAVGRAAICPFMAMDTHSLLLFPEAFVVLVLSKLYLVTRGALVPEMASTVVIAGPEQPNESLDPTLELALPAGAPAPAAPVVVEFAALNARLTLLGTLAGFAASVPAGVLYKLGGSPAVLVFDTFVFIAAAVAGFRLPVPAGTKHRSGLRELRSDGAVRAQIAPVPSWGPHPEDEKSEWTGTTQDQDLARLQPMAHPEVLFGLTTMSLIRGLAGFLILLLAFGLRRAHAALYWYGLALGGSGIGAIVGLSLVSRLRKWLVEQNILLAAIWLISLGAIAAAYWNALLAQAFLSFVVGIAGSLAQPSFDALTQRFVPVASQGRAFAKFATRQQLVWCIGALIPVVVAFPFQAGDVVMAVVGGVGGVFYVTSRRALKTRAMLRQHRHRE